MPRDRKAENNTITGYRKGKEYLWCVCFGGEEGRRVYSHFLDSNTNGDLIFSILGAFLFPTPFVITVWISVQFCSKIVNLWGYLKTISVLFASVHNTVFK